MPKFRVTLVASYAPTLPIDRKDALVYTGPTLTQPQEVKERLGAWVESREGRTLIGDYVIDPPRLTLKVVYNEFDAPSEWEAGVDARSLFAEESVADDLPSPETVVAHPRGAVVGMPGQGKSASPPERYDTPAARK